MSADLKKILECCHHDPFSYLGVHFSQPTVDHVTIRTFQPHASRVNFLLQNDVFSMEKTDSEGIFELVLVKKQLSDPDLSPFNYQYEIQYKSGISRRINDPYRFPVLLGEMDRYLFNAGRNYKLYQHFGCHPRTVEHVSGCLFRVWAPNSIAVSVIGDFNGWDGRVHQMRSLGISGIWELFIPNLQENERYRYHIRTGSGAVLEKSDPFQFYGELRPSNASITKKLDSYQWNDQNWQQRQKTSSPYTSPISIYELHPGSWRRDPDNPERFLTFRELATELIPYMIKLGFTHVELMPVMEHPLDESWGYQVTGPFSITSRYGTPEEFMFFVDSCHQNNIGVILDWVPAHFPKDPHSLGRFDGTPLYEHEDERKGSHPDWGTFIYNYGRNEVSNYLIANALFWLDVYHIDGLRVDAVASMLYLDYSRKDGEWIPNQYGGRENLEAIEFIRHLNSILYEFYPDLLLIAEESTSFPGVSRPADKGGLGFGFKWNMGWMNDTLSYFSKDPLYRKFHHNELTFSMMYAYSENFILPLSHDEVVHGKRSLLEKMPGDEWQQFANLRLLFFTQWMHPGKKLLFMGGEFGQRTEWNCKQSLDWHLIQENILHGQLQHFITALNHIYKTTPALWERDYTGEGFQWLNQDDTDNSILVYGRFGNNRKEHIICVFNYTPQTFCHYNIRTPCPGNYRVVFCTDGEKFGGSGFLKSENFQSRETKNQGEYQAEIELPPLGGMILQHIP
ncbi:1,4-alpha-glucan branching protein GlgB [Desulfomarina sp.]